MRWHRTEGELRSPMEFIPIAEDTGEIVPIGLWVLEEACRRACAWDATGVLFSSIAVNVSAVQLRDPEFAERVLAICARTGWPTRRLVLELTESALMRDTDVLRRTFAVFEENGINLGHAMGLTVIAKGVESAISMRALRNQSFNEAQGYHLTRPLMPATREAWIRARGAAAG